MPDREMSVITDLLHDTVASGKIFYLNLTTESMRPLLHSGDQVGIEAPTPQHLKPGDIIVLQDANGFMTHRFWGVIDEENALRLITRGDRSQSFDPPWREDQLMGQVVTRRRGAHLLRLDRGPGNWLNRHLAFLSRLEWRLLGSESFTATISEHPVTLLQKSFPARLLRRGILAWAAIINALVGILSRDSAGIDKPKGRRLLQGQRTD